MFLNLRDLKDNLLPENFLGLDPAAAGLGYKGDADNDCIFSWPIHGQSDLWKTRDHFRFCAIRALEYIDQGGNIVAWGRRLGIETNYDKERFPNCLKSLKISGKLSVKYW